MGDSSHPANYNVNIKKLCMTSGLFADEDVHYQEFADDSCCRGRSRSFIAQGSCSGARSPRLPGIEDRLDAATPGHLEYDILGACLSLFGNVISTSLNPKADQELQLCRRRP